jgi:hypothetical protein
MRILLCGKSGDKEGVRNTHFGREGNERELTLFFSRLNDFLLEALSVAMQITNASGFCGIREAALPGLFSSVFVFSPAASARANWSRR